MSRVLNRGHKLFWDNWFNSPLLSSAAFLKRNKTDCVGTLRKSRKNVPAIIQVAALPEETCIARHSGDVVVMAYQDKKPIYTISTCHGTDSVFCENRPGRPAQFKLSVIVDYNHSINGVDKKRSNVRALFSAKEEKWYKKLFKHLLIAIIMYKYV